MQSKECKGLACYEDDLDMTEDNLDMTQTFVTKEPKRLTTETGRSYVQETEANYDTTEGETNIIFFYIRGLLCILTSFQVLGASEIWLKQNEQTTVHIVQTQKQSKKEKFVHY